MWPKIIQLSVAHVCFFLPFPTQGELEDPRNIDPRERILRHADKKDDEFSKYLEAYKATQPTPIYAQDEDEEQNDED